MKSLLPLLIAAVAPISQAANFTNPVVYEDFADNDVSVGPDGLFYLSASNMHYSPGAPILRSPNLVDWELIGHSVPTLDFGERYNLTNGQAYRGGTWASTLRHRASNRLWYWIGCVDFWYTYIYTAPSATGPWTRAAMLPGGTCYYDCGLLIDDDDTMYVAYGATDVRVAQLSADGLSEVTSAPVFSAADVGADGIEGNRMYKRNGTYYILNDHPGDTTYVWKASTPWGPYTAKVLVSDMASPIPGGGAPHQGSLVETSGDWYYMSFTWAYPSGRIPVLAPITWGPDGFPSFVPGAGGGWGASYPLPQLPAPAAPPSWTGTDRFPGPSLAPAWEWNHNPDPSAYALDGGLTLSTASVTDDLHAARNTLTHRVHGEFPTGAVLVDVANMADGDRAGLAAFRDRSAWVGVAREGDAWDVRVVHGLAQNATTWETTSEGTVVASVAVDAPTKVWLRVAMDARADGARTAVFSYRAGEEGGFVELGPAFGLATGWEYFMGYRFAVFNYATKRLGGSVSVEEFVGA